ncbi:transporter [Aureococcus anophagefferens]|nr:transporter [Aureococcus anophagefferens]
MGCCGPADVGRRKVLVALLANAGAAMNFSTIEIAVMLMGDAEGLTRGWEMSVLDSLVFAGCIIGMVSFGYVGDRVGRVKGLQAAMFLSVFGVVLSATPMDTEAEVAAVLCVARFVLGVGIGGVYPLAAALAYERSDSDAVGELSVARRTSGSPAACSRSTRRPTRSTRRRASTAARGGGACCSWAPCPSRGRCFWDGLPKSDRPPAPPPAKAAGAAPKAGDAFLALLEEDRGFRVALGGAAAAWLGYNTYAYGIICYYPELESAILGDDWPGIAIYALPNTFAPPHVRARAHGLAAALGKATRLEHEPLIEKAETLEAP